MDRDRPRDTKFWAWAYLEYDYESWQRKRCGQDEVNDETDAGYSCFVRFFDYI